jgi:epsilon-lactone hydrolase
MASWQSKTVSTFFKLYSSIRVASEIDVVRLRNHIEALARWAPPVAGVSTTEKNIAGIPSLSIDSEKFSRDRIILYLHGGAYNICSYNTHKRMVSRLAIASGTPALLINYRLAPEHPYPAALDDAMAAYHFFLSKKYRQIILAGDSAGGGLALAAMFRIRDEKLTPPTCVVTLSPWMDLTLSKWHELHDAMLHKDKLVQQAKKYYADHNPENPYISPMFGDFQNFPAVLIQVSAREAIYNEILLTAEKMEQQKVQVTLQIWEDVVHVWQAYHFMPEAKEAIKKIGEFIRARCD